MGWLEDAGNTLLGTVEGVTGTITGGVDAITGASAYDIQQQQLQQQEAYNQQLLALEAERLAFQNSPEYLEQQRKRWTMFGLIGAFALVVIVFIIVKLRK
jgi:hypothetical protein